MKRGMSCEGERKGWRERRMGMEGEEEVEEVISCDHEREGGEL